MHCAARLRARLRAVLRPAPDVRIRDGEALSIALSVLPVARGCAGAAAATLLATAMQLVVQGQLLLALSFLLVLVIAASGVRRDLLLRGPGAPVWLVLTTEGALSVYCRNGHIEPVRLRPQSLRIGGGLLMILRGNRTYRLWLASGNVKPGTLAALHRRLGRDTAAPAGLR